MDIIHTVLEFASYIAAIVSAGIGTAMIFRKCRPK